MKLRWISLVTYVVVLNLITASSIGTPIALAHEAQENSAPVEESLSTNTFSEGSIPGHVPSILDTKNRILPAYFMASQERASDFSLPHSLDVVHRGETSRGEERAIAGQNATGTETSSIPLPITLIRPDRDSTTPAAVIDWSRAAYETLGRPIYYTPTLKTVDYPVTNPYLVFTDTVYGPITISLVLNNNSITQTTTFAYSPVPTGTIASFSIGHRLFNLGAYQNGVPAPNLNLGGQGVVVTVQYVDDDVAGLDEKNLRLNLWDTARGSWVNAATTCALTSTTYVFTRTNQLRTTICRLSQYPAALADFQANPTSGPTPLTVVFTNTSMGDYSDSLWNFGDGVTSTVDSPTHTYTLPGVYTVSLRVSDPGGTNTNTLTRTNYITAYEPAVADFTALPTSGERPLTVVFTNTSTGSFSDSSWNFGDGGTSTTTNPSHIYTNAGVYTVTLTVSGLGGTDTVTRSNLITVDYATVSAGFTASPLSGARPLTVTFVNTSTGDYTTSAWTFGDSGTSSDTNPTHTYATPGLYTVTLNVSGPGGSDGMTRTNYISVTYQPVNADFSGTPQSGVVPLSVSFTNNSTGDYSTSAWTFGDGGSSSDTNPVYTYTTAGVYTVTLTASGLGGTDTQTRTNYIQVYNPVSASFTASPLTGTFPLTVSFTDGSTGDIALYSWNFGDGGTSTTASPSHTYTGPGVYTVTLTVTGMGGDVSTMRRTNYITVYTPANADFSGTPQSGAAPLFVTFTNNSTGDYNTSAWTFGDGGSSSDTNPVYTYTTAGVYTVTLTVSGLGGSDTLTRTNYIQVYNPVSASFTASPLTGTFPLTVSFTDGSTGDIALYSWNFGDGGTSTTASPSHTYTGPGVYTVTLTVTGMGGDVSIMRRTNYITVYTPASADFSGTPRSGVTPLAVTFTNNSTGDYDTSAWTFGDGGSSSDTNPVYTYTTAGVYTVTLTVSGLGGSDTLTRTNYIQVYNPVSASFTASPISGTSPLLVSFTNNSTGDVSAYVWTFGDGTTSMAVAPSHTYTRAGVYTVTLTSTGLGGDVSTMRRTNYITVSPAPVAANFTASPTSGERPLLVAFTNTSTGDYTNSAWNFGDGGTSTSNSPNHTYNSVGVYTVSLQVSGPGGTDALTRTNYITVNYASVSANFTADPTSGPVPLVVTFTNTSSGDFNSSVWNFGDGVTSTVLMTPTHTYTQPGYYTVTLQVSGPGGSDVLTRTNLISVADNSISTVIDPIMGGTIVFTNPSGSSTMIIVPTGAVTRDITLTYTPVPTTSVPPGFLFAGQAFTLIALDSGTPITHFTFLRPVAFTINYVDSEVVGLDEDTLVLYYWDTISGTWKDVATTCTPNSTYWRYPANNKIVVGVCHLSEYGMFGQVDYKSGLGPIYLPLILRLD